MEKLIEIRDLRQLGALVQAVRKRQHLRQDEVGRISHSFIGELEAGKPTAQIGKVMQAMSELGIRLHLELPAGMNAPTA
jgi:transcriptional regulator with XRE-family HTH domain